jgi:hypothetical protein
MTKLSNSQLMADIEEGLSTSEIAERHDMATSTIRYRKRQLVAKGWTKEISNKEFISPEVLKGRSVLYGPGGEVKLEWVKTNIDREQELLAIKGAIDSMAEAVPREAPVPWQKPHMPSNLMNLFVLTDFHLGMLAWGEETGADWDLNIAEGLLVRWFAAAIDAAPPAQVAVLGQLGDFLHWDGLDAVTPSSGHVLDADTRFQKLTRVAIRALRRIIRMLLEKFPQVHVICAEGNHDMASSIWLRELLSALYEDEPRITVDRNPDPYYCYEFGSVALFFHHGHKRKAEQLETVLVAKFREVYGRTKHAYAHVGHLHHKKVLESPVMVIEQHRTLAAKDAYASRGGWLSERSASVITYHADYGEVARVTINPEMLE